VDTCSIGTATFVALHIEGVTGMIGVGVDVRGAGGEAGVAVCSTIVRGACGKLCVSTSTGDARVPATSVRVGVAVATLARNLEGSEEVPDIGFGPLGRTVCPPALFLPAVFASVENKAPYLSTELSSVALGDLPNDFVAEQKADLPFL
jgi:hypothetical protein